MTVALTPGKTYSIAGQLTLAADGQVLDGNGATIKKRNQVVTTTSTSLTAGSTSQINVASTNSIFPGVKLVLEQGGNFDTTAREVQSVSGNTVTFKTPVGISASGTINVYLALVSVWVSGRRCKVTGVRFFGNRANWSWARWWHTAEINFDAAADSVVEHCYITEAPGEGILVNDSENARVLFNTFVNVDGNGVHYGGNTACNGGRIVGNNIRNANLDPSVGHADGCVVLSNVVGDLLVANNRLDTGIAGVGSIDAADNSDVTIVGNEIRGCTVAIEGDVPNNVDVFNILIEANRIYNSGQLTIKSEGGDGGGPNPVRWTVRGNLFSETRLHLNVVTDCVVEGNIFNFGSLTSTAAVPIYCYAAKQTVIANNVIKGGIYGVHIEGSHTEALTVTGNTLDRQGSFGIVSSYALAPGSLLVSNNTITADSTADNGYEGIRSHSGAVVRANQVKLTKGSKGIYLQGGTKMLVCDNYVIKGGASYSIKIENTVTSAFVKDNETDAQIFDAGTTTTLTGNVVL